MYLHEKVVKGCISWGQLLALDTALYPTVHWKCLLEEHGLWNHRRLSAFIRDPVFITSFMVNTPHRPIPGIHQVMPLKAKGAGNCESENI